MHILPSFGPMNDSVALCSIMLHHFGIGLDYSRSCSSGILFGGHQENTLNVSIH